MFVYHCRASVVSLDMDNTYTQRGLATSLSTTRQCKLGWYFLNWILAPAIASGPIKETPVSDFTIHIKRVNSHEPNQRASTMMKRCTALIVLLDLRASWTRHVLKPIDNNHKENNVNSRNQAQGFTPQSTRTRPRPSKLSPSPRPRGRRGS